MSAAGTRVAPFVRRMPQNLNRIHQPLTTRLRAMPQVRAMSQKVAQQLAARITAAISRTQSSPTILKAWRSLSRMRRVVARSNVRSLGTSTVTERGVLQKARHALREMRKGSWGDITTRELMDELLNAHYLSQTGFNPTVLSQKLTT